MGFMNDIAFSDPMGIVYPPAGSPEASEIDLWLNIRAYSYSLGKRKRAHGGGNMKCDFWFPMPKQMATATSIGYSTGEAPEKGWLSSAVDFFTTAGGIGSIFTGVLGWFESASGAAKHIGKRDMDNREQLFGGAGFRQHTYTWTFAPKSSEDANLLFNMAYRLNALAYPGAALQISKMYHPPLFFNTVYQGPGEGAPERKEWSFDPQVCVLESVAVDRTAAGKAYAVGRSEFLPAVWKLSLTFKELEPLVRSQISDRLVSRSASDTAGVIDF